MFPSTPPPCISTSWGVVLLRSGLVCFALHTGVPGCFDLVLGYNRCAVYSSLQTGVWPIDGRCVETRNPSFDEWAKLAFQIDTLDLNMER